MIWWNLRKLREGDATSKRHAIRELRTHPTEQVYRALVDTIERTRNKNGLADYSGSADSVVCSESIDALRTILDSGRLPVPCLVSTLDFKQPEVLDPCLPALQRLLEAGLVERQPVIEAILDDSHLPVCWDRQSFRVFLDVLFDKTHSSELVVFLSKEHAPPSMSFRKDKIVYAIDRLARLTQAPDAIAKYLEFPDSVVSEAALKAVGAHGRRLLEDQQRKTEEKRRKAEEEQIGRLLRCLGEERSGILGNEAGLLRQIPAKGPKALERLLNVLKGRNDFTSETRLGAFKALCEFGRDEAVPQLIAFYRECKFAKTSDVEAKRVFEALKRIGTPDSIAFLANEVAAFCSEFSNAELGRSMTLHSLGKTAVSALESCLRNGLGNTNIPAHALDKLAQLPREILPIRIHSEDAGYKYETVNCSNVKTLADRNLRARG